MSENKAHRQQHSGGTRGNRNYDKPDYVSKHAKSNIGIQDPRTTKIQIMLTHERKSVMNKTIELYQLEKEKKKWESDGFKVTICN